MVDLTQHSPLGGSGAYRWMPAPYGGNCPGSVRLSYGVEDPESEYAIAGKGAHALAEACLTDGTDAWTKIGDGFCLEVGGVDDGPCIYYPGKDEADSVQVYLNAVRSAHPNFDLKTTAWVEHEFYCPTIHEYCWGKADFACIQSRTLHARDFKNGVLDVEVIQNPQLMYYGCGLLESLYLWDDIDTVVLHIDQPNGFNMDGPSREWTIQTEDLLHWMHTVLIPAMDRALASRDTASGEHCRFCPARARACPQIMSDMDELETMVMRIAQTNDRIYLMEKMKASDAAPELTNEQVGRFQDLLDVARVVGPAVSDVGFGRMMAGQEVPGRKLVKATKHRTWKDGAEDELVEKYSLDAYYDPKLKSPSEVEKMIGGKKLTARHAFKPDGGLAAVSVRDKRQPVDRDPARHFEDQTKRGEPK